MAEYASNSDRSREQVDHAPLPEPKSDGLVQGRKMNEPVKKSGFAKFIDKLVRSETGESLEGYFMKSVADMFCHGVGVIADLISDTISIKLTDKPARSRGNGYGARVSYRQYYDEDEDDRGYRKRSSRREETAAGVENYADVIFETRGDAEICLERMYELLDRFDAVSVGDLYDIAKIKHDYQTNKYGWTDLGNAHVERTRDGYVLALPKATSL